MIVIYTPKGGEPEHYDANSLKVSEAAIVQRTVDMKWQEILAGLGQDDLDAMRGIVWVIKKRSQPALRWGDFDPGVLEMTSRMDDDEIEHWITTTVANADADLEWETIQTLIDSRLDQVAVNPEHARAVLAAQAPDPKAEPTGQDSGSDPEPPTQDPSPSPTSSEPGTPISDSSRTSSTSRRKQSTTSPSATSTP